MDLTNPENSRYPEDSRWIIQNAMQLPLTKKGFKMSKMDFFKFKFLYFDL